METTLSTVVTNIPLIINSFKSILSTIKDVNLKSQLNDLYDKILELQTGLLTTQTSYFALINENNELKQELNKIRGWELEKSKYKLTEISEGTFIYLYQNSNDSNEPTHAICPNCYSKNIKSILQKVPNTNNKYRCPSCHLQVSLETPMYNRKFLKYKSIQ